MAQAFTDADIQLLAQKLTQFNQTLTPGEQTALAEVILRGALKSGEVQGYFDRRDRGNEGAIGVQEGADPFSPIINIFAPPTKKGMDRPAERK